MTSTWWLTTNTDIADTAESVRGTVPSTFKFTSADEVVVATSRATAATSTLNSADYLADGSTTDNDVLQLTISGGTNAAAIPAPVISNIETIEIATSSALTGAHTVNLTSVTGLKDVVISGASGSSITLSNAQGSGLTTVDASGQTGANGDVVVDMATSTSAASLTFVGGAGDDAFRGAAGNDSITGGAGADLLIGGSGADTISGGAGVDNIVGGTGADVITSGGGSDFIALGNATIAAFAANGTFTAGTGTVDTSIDTVIFEATASANGNDAIEGFSAGLAAANGDILDVSAFLGKAVSYAESTATAVENMIGVNVVVVTDAAANAAALANYTFSANEKVVVVDDAGANADVFFGTADGNGLVTALTQVATLVGVGTPADLEANNFFGG